MTRKKAWMIAGAVTVSVILLVIAVGSSFGQFGLGGSSSIGVQASASGQQAERRVDADTISDGEPNEDEEGDDDDDGGEDDEHEEEDD